MFNPLMQTVEQRIKQLRLQMMIHSYLYYERDDIIIDDHEWQARANELTELQAKCPNLKLNCYDEDFKDWNGSTGCHLRYDSKIISKADQLLRTHEERLINLELENRGGIQYVRH